MDGFDSHLHVCRSHSTSKGNRLNKDLKELRWDAQMSSASIRTRTLLVTLKGQFTPILHHCSLFVPLFYQWDMIVPTYRGQCLDVRGDTPTLKIWSLLRLETRQESRRTITPLPNNKRLSWQRRDTGATYTGSIHWLITQVKHIKVEWMTESVWRPKLLQIITEMYVFNMLILQNQHHLCAPKV